MRIVLLIILFLAIFIGCREDIVEYEDTANTGDLYLNSSPRGAEIFLNESKIGKTTPDSLIDLQAGSYTVKFRLTGYGERIVVVNLPSGEKRFVNVTFYNN